MSNDAEPTIKFSKTSGEELEGHALRLGRYELSFDVYGPENSLRTSEVLPKLTVKIRDQVLYEGKATVATLVNTSGGMTCKVMLDEHGINPASLADGSEPTFQQFQQRWLAGYKILPEFKIVVADIEIFLTNLRQWVDEIELADSVRKKGQSERVTRLLEQIGPSVVASFNSLHERFEEISYRIEPALRPVHQNYARRQLHPLFMSAPFAHRTYYKPLGYAGDYPGPV